jgi:hypothetical protein
MVETNRLLFWFGMFGMFASIVVLDWKVPPEWSLWDDAKDALFGPLFEPKQPLQHNISVSPSDSVIFIDPNPCENNTDWESCETVVHFPEANEKGRVLVIAEADCRIARCIKIVVPEGNKISMAGSWRYLRKEYYYMVGRCTSATLVSDGENVWHVLSR